MEPGKLSFIPKSSATKTSSYRTIYKEAGLGLFMKATVFLFILSMAGFGGAYLYKKSLTQEIADLSSSLERAKAAFDPVLITEMENLMFSLANAKNLLDQHAYPSNIFAVIQGVTHQRVRFTNFAYSPRYVGKDGAANGLNVNLTGEADSYRVLAEQARIFEGNSDIKNYTFGNFVLNEKGILTFDLDLTLDLSVLYRQPADSF